MKKLKKNVIVEELFSLIMKHRLENNTSLEEGINVPMSELLKHLNKKYNIGYHSSSHIYNQLKSYERKTEILLFKKSQKDGQIIISLTNLSDFHQLLYSNKGLKILLANGTLELIKKIAEFTKHPIKKIYIGTGSECYYFAELLFQKYNSYHLEIYTHNLGVINLYCSPSKKLNNIRVYTNNGIIDKNTFALIDQKQYSIKNVDFDIVIQSPRYVKEDKVYVQNKIEKDICRKVLKTKTGTKIMLLTLFELLCPSNIEPYGKVKDFDYIITPPKELYHGLYDKYINTITGLELFVQYFQFNIHKVIH